MTEELIFGSPNLCLGIWDPGVMSDVETVLGSGFSRKKLPGNVDGMVIFRQVLWRDVVGAMAVLVCEGFDGIERINMYRYNHQVAANTKPRKPKTGIA